MKKYLSPRLALICAVSLFAACQTHQSNDCDDAMNKQDEKCTKQVKNTSVKKAGKGPLPYGIYVRGGFNGWGSDNPFVHVGGGVYEATLRAAPGNHEFKMAPKDWKEEWVIADSGGKPAQPNRTYRLKKGGAGSFLFVRKTGYYKFRLDFSNMKNPNLIITETSGPKTKAVDPHKRHKQSQKVGFTTWDGKKEDVTFSVNVPDHKLRRYAQSTTQALRDPVPQYRRYEEKEGYPRVRSGNLSFDALFAMSMEEMRLDGVENIRDGNYNEGDSIPCSCFETGAKWHYVWTRDLSYAAHLGLAMFDPQRVVNSLEFKLSPYREGIEKASAVPGTNDGLQIVQDTGTGGSWPISTDRMTWAFGAAKVLENMSSVERHAFAEKAYEALKNTIEIDRVAAFDGRDGLYYGEQSFLDWRDQTYATWIVEDIASLGFSKSLSTNVGHFQALRLASDLAQELGDVVTAVKYSDWASDLKNAINTRFWLTSEGQYSSITAAHFDDAPLYKYDWLGISLAVITGVADENRATEALSNYPHGPMGAPVIFPQQPTIPVYHNRAIWPFVTAYGLKAATTARHSLVADEAYRTLIRAASLNMSNMENLEWLSGQPLLLDENNPGLSGPVINSQRQLWSVGAYLGMVVDSLFGVKTSDTGVSFEPFISSGIRREQFKGSRSIGLFDLTLQNKNFDIRVYFPEATTAQGYYRIDSVLINGKEHKGELLWKDAKDANTVVVRLGRLIQDGHRITRVKGDPYSADDPALFAPVEPNIVMISSDGVPTFKIDDASNKNASYTLYQDGKKYKDITQNTFGGAKNSPNACYALEAKFASGTVSHHSVPVCVGQRVEIYAGDNRISSNIDATKDKARDGAFIPDWGKQSDKLEINGVEIAEQGEFAFQLKYHNAYNQINLGVSNGVKWVRVLDENNNEVATGTLQMPHARVIDGQRPWVYSTPLFVKLTAGRYRLVFEDFTNMSYLKSNTTFTGNGGASGPVNRFDIRGLSVLQISESSTGAE